MRFDVSLIPTLTLFAMMLSMGMTLRPADFGRVLQHPRAVGLGAAGQLVLLPAVALAIAKLLALSDTLAIGLVLIAACPGGITSNALATFARGDLALSISLTALSSCAAFLTVPFVVNLGFVAFAAEGEAVRLPVLETVSTLFVTTVAPVALGMAARQRRPALALRLHRPLLVGSTAILLLLTASLGVSLWASAEDMAGLFTRAAPAVVLLLAVMTAAGLLGARALGLDPAHGRTIAIEFGMQNFNLALVLAFTLLGEQRYAGTALVYLPVMFVFASGVIAASHRYPSAGGARAATL